MRPISALSRRSMWRRAADAIEQGAHFAGIEDRRFAFAHDMPRPAHRQRRIGPHDVARHQPIEQVTDRGQAQLDRRHRMRRLQILDPRRDMDRQNIDAQIG